MRNTAISRSRVLNRLRWRLFTGPSYASDLRTLTVLLQEGIGGPGEDLNLHLR
jgi:hypothetical protein